MFYYILLVYQYFCSILHIVFAIIELMIYHINFEVQFCQYALTLLEVMGVEILNVVPLELLSQRLTFERDL